RAVARRGGRRPEHPAGHRARPPAPSAAHPPPPAPRTRFTAAQPTDGGPTMTSANFEDRLLAELRKVVAARPAPAAPARRRRPGVRVAIAAATVAAVAAIVAVLASSGGVTSDAYAVTPRSNGSVVVQIHSLSDAAGLQAKLRAAGVPADV